MESSLQVLKQGGMKGGGEGGSQSHIRGSKAVSGWGVWL